MIFNLISTPERVAAISRKYHELCGDWRPTYSNLKSLYIKNGKDWEKTPIKDAAGIQRQEAWADMPQAAIDYLRTLPEFDPEIFFQITGHDYTVLEEG